MIPCAEIVSRASIINTWKILGDYQVFVENTRESLLTQGSVADSSSDSFYSVSSNCLNLNYQELPPYNLAVNTES